MTTINSRLTFLAYVLILTLFLNGCSEKRNKKAITVGVSIANFNDKFLSYIKNEMEKYQSELGDDIDVLYFDAAEDLQKQEQQVGYLLEKKVDALVVIPVNTEHTQKITDMAKNAETPLIYINRYPDEFLNKELPQDVYYIGSDEKIAGMMQMDYLAKKLNGKGDIAILMGNLSNRAAFDRTLGIEDEAKKYPGINIVVKSTGKWLEPFAGSIVEAWLKEGQQFDAIASNNDEMAIGAIRALKKYKMLDKILVVGVDGTKEALQELNYGNLDATVLQDAKGQGKAALENAYNISKGKAVRSITWTPFKLLSGDSLHDS